MGHPSDAIHTVSKPRKDRAVSTGPEKKKGEKKEENKTPDNWSNSLIGMVWMADH